jgi:hypothetical protein
VPPPLRPRAFISYRHSEYEDVANADALNLAHRNWVAKFAHDLRSAGVDTIYDGDLRELFAFHSDADPDTAPFMAEISSISFLVSHAFIVILTPSYLDRIGYGDYRNQSHVRLSYAQEEWNFGMRFCNAGILHYVPIVRAGDPERMMPLPLGVGPDTTFDMRDPAHYPHQTGFIAERILHAWDGDYPLLKVDVGNWLQLYIQWCRDNYPGCRDEKVEDWKMDLLRPRLFIDAIVSGVKKRMGG